MAILPSVLIVDDHPVFRDALDAAVDKACEGSCTTTHASNIAEALARLDEAPYDLVLLDLNLSDSSDFDGLAKINLADIDAPVMIVSATESALAYTTAKSLGARGYLPKSIELDDMAKAIRSVLAGHSAFPDIDTGLNAEQQELVSRIAALTPAQRRVLSGLADGMLNKQIAYEMGISIATVKAYMTAIFRKLGVNNRTQALLVYKSATAI